MSVERCQQLQTTYQPAFVSSRNKNGDATPIAWVSATRTKSGRASRPSNAPSNNWSPLSMSAFVMTQHGHDDRQDGEHTNTLTGCCSCSFAEHRANNVRQCSLFAKNVRRAIIDKEKQNE